MKIEKSQKSVGQNGYKSIHLIAVFFFAFYSFIMIFFYEKLILIITDMEKIII
jgi:hypothetical protein